MKLKRDTQPENPDLLAPFEDYLRRRGPELFAPGRPVTAARAPGRIDVMGGIADYSGSVVFEGPLRRAAVVAFQPRNDGRLVAHSTTFEDGPASADVDTNLADLREPSGDFLPYADLRDALASDEEAAWAAYLFGALPVLEKERVHRFDGGTTFLLWSDIPIGVGVSSSAALEVAAMYAALSHFRLELPGDRFSGLAQMVENEVVGAPCGIMDQVTSALGESGKLLALRCQPCDLLGQHELPDGIRVFGLSSRVEHSVAGAAYAAARISAFMGLKIILTEKRNRGLELTEEDHYLCNLSPEEYIAEYRHLLPERVGGREFLDTWGETIDSVTTVDPEATYRVRAGTDHPISENHRVKAFIACMDRARAGDRTALIEAGGLMYASHWSYGENCGLGCAETDLIVRLVRERGPEHGLYGAKITGGGSGGTVAILADAEAEPTVRGIAEAYLEATDLEPDIFADTSPGAYAFGPVTYRFEPE
ncbi:MAG: GHMP kinase [Candidatus Brocadiia bacterium]